MANTVEPLLGAVLLRPIIGVPDLTRRRDVVAFVACCALAGPVAGAAIGSTTMAVIGGGNWSFLPFCTGDALGVLPVATVVLAWRDQAGR